MKQKKPPLILIVDDEERMRRVITDYLRIKGYDTMEAGDGVEALELFGRRTPDLVLLDVMMPRMDGWEACRAIHAQSDVPIIMLTARGQEEDELQGFSLGADEYITKPFSLKILLARIEAVLRRAAGGPAAPDTGAENDIPGLTVDRDGREVRVDGVPVEGDRKMIELRRFANAKWGEGGWELAASYGDHHSDRALLAGAKQGFAVCPDRPLGRTARERGYQVLEW